MTISAFNDLTDLYEAMIDWPKRLTNEEPFYRHWFDKIGVRRVVDVACGTGQHAAMFHAWGLEVEAADLSPAMIARARASFGEDQRLCWLVRSFDQPIAIDNDNKQHFDAALCMGNSLALAPDLKTAECALEQMFAAVRSGGIVLVQVLNLWRLPDGPCVWQKCKKATLAGRTPLNAEPTTKAAVESTAQNENEIEQKSIAVTAGAVPSEGMENEMLIVKGVHRSGSRGYVDILSASLKDGKLLQHESLPFLGLESSRLEQVAHQAGAKTIHLFGDYRQQPYTREKSVDLILVAEK